MYLPAPNKIDIEQYVTYYIRFNGKINMYKINPSDLFLVI